MSSWLLYSIEKGSTCYNDIEAGYKFNFIFSLFKLSNLRACTSGSSDQQNACMIKKIPETKDLEACILVACSKL